VPGLFSDIGQENRITQANLRAINPATLGAALRSSAGVESIQLNAMINVISKLKNSLTNDQRAQFPADHDWANENSDIRLLTQQTFIDITPSFANDALSVISAPTSLPDGVIYDPVTHRLSFDPSNATYRGLVQGATQDITITFQVGDGLGLVMDASMVLTITGTNDLPVVGNVVLSSIASASAGSSNNLPESPTPGAIPEIANAPTGATTEPVFTGVIEPAFNQEMASYVPEHISYVEPAFALIESEDNLAENAGVPADPQYSQARLNVLISYLAQDIGMAQADEPNAGAAIGYQPPNKELMTIGLAA